MKELTELRIQGNQLVLRDNLVKESVLPLNYAEMDRDVLVQGHAIVEGALFARSFLISAGPLRVDGAVYAQREIHVQSSCRDAVEFRKSVGTAGTVASLATAGRVYFGADVNASTVNLRGAYIAANVFADDVTLENCVVLGGVFASKKLSMTNCIVGTFHSPEVRLGQEIILLLPAAFSVAPISALPGTRVRNWALVDLAALMRGASVRENTGWILMDPAREEQRTDLVDEKGNSQVVRSYSVAAKVLTADILDLGQLQNHFLLAAGSLGAQTLQTYDLGTGPDGAPIELTAPTIAAFFFRILDGQVDSPELSGDLSFDDIRRAFEV